MPYKRFSLVAWTFSIPQCVQCIPIHSALVVSTLCDVLFLFEIQMHGSTWTSKFDGVSLRRQGQPGITFGFIAAEQFDELLEYRNYRPKIVFGEICPFV